MVGFGLALTIAPGGEPVGGMPSARCGGVALHFTGKLGSGWTQLAALVAPTSAAMSSTTGAFCEQENEAPAHDYPLGEVRFRWSTA
ncbi:hypothetical protein [Nocardia sp. NPDC003979]